MSSDPHWLTGEVISESHQPWILGLNRTYFMLGLKTVGMFFLIFTILTLNFLALSVALQCNRGTQRQTKVALFAFFFGPFYLLVNYYFLRIRGRGEDCEFSNINPFPYFTGRNVTQPQAAPTAPVS